MVSGSINKPHSGAANEWCLCFPPRAGQGCCHQPTGIYQVLIGIWTPQSNKGIMMYNISFIDFRVTNEPVEVDETLTKTMYICLFLGGFWCGTVTFIMLLAIHTHCGRLRTRQRCGLVTTASPFWSDWQSSISSRLTGRDWASTADYEATSCSTASEDSEYRRVINWECDSRAIHFWRPFEDHLLPKAASRCELGEWLVTNYKDLEGSRSRENRCDMS